MAYIFRDDVKLRGGILSMMKQASLNGGSKVLTFLTFPECVIHPWQSQHLNFRYGPVVYDPVIRS